MPMRVLVQVLHALPKRTLALALDRGAFQMGSKPAIKGLPRENGDALDLKVAT